MSKVTAVSAMPGPGNPPRSTKITEDLLVCRLCSLKYSVHGRRPIALRCVHTFCECCLEQLLRDQKDDDDVAKNQKGSRKSKRQQLACPTCESVTLLARGCSPSSLPINPSIMELLEIFHHPAPAVGRNETTGFSQVKVNTITTHGGNFVNRESITKTEQPSANGNMNDDIGGVSQGHVNWVSTVNIGGSLQQEQHQEQQQQQQQQQAQQQQLQQRGSVFKLTSTPAAAVTPVVTSFSTLRVQSEQSPGANALSSSGTNSGSPQTTAKLHGDTHMCCRCGTAPATVSVASSSQTMVPQKLCSECWKLSATRTKQGGMLYEGKTTVAGTNPRIRTNASKNQPTDGTVATSRISTAKTSATSGVSAPTNDVVNTVPKSVNKDNVISKLATVGDRRSVVTNGKSTIEVRRRSSLIDNRSLAAATSTSSNDSDRIVNEQASVAASSVVERNQPAASIQQLPVTSSPSPDTETRTPDIRGSNASVPRNTDHREHGGNHAGLGRPSSAPSIAEVHPLPCSNPPYNPDFGDDVEPALSTGQYRDYAAASSRRPDPPTSETRNQERLQRKQQEQDVSATTNRGTSLSFVLSKSRYGYPPEQPPKYEDIIRETGQVTATAPDVAAGAAQTQPSPPFASSSVELSASTASPPSTSAMRLVRSFGKYGEISTQPGVFQAPRRLSVSPGVMAATDDRAREASWTNCRIVVGDRANGTVQVFSDAGECLSMLRADGVAGCCLLSHNQRLILATDRGVETYDINGSRQDSLPMGAVLNVVPYERGFIAVQSKSLSVFKGTSFSTRARTLTSKAKPGQFNRLLQFDDICDVAVNSHQDLVVLEATAGGLITIMADDGYIKSTISPSKLEGCGGLHMPTAVAVDSAHNIIVSESGSSARVLLFGANGRLQRILLGPNSQLTQSNRVGAATTETRGPWPTGLAVSPDDRLYVVMHEDKFAEIRIYEYV